MIPLQLHIKNFLSYSSRPQTINFAPYHLICLSGKNGHGKSALLDALTWVIWGQARKTTNTAKADAGLVRLGQTHMMVMLDFECNNNRYRIRREYIQMPSKPHATLDFGIFCQTTNQFSSLTEKTIKKTQEVINRTLGITFESFTNSAFLRQGEANEFSKKAPKDRKEILAQILGIAHYEQIRKRAAEKIKETLGTKSTLQALQDQSAQELASLPTVTEQIKQIDRQLAENKTAEQQLMHHETALHHERTRLSEKKNKNMLITFQINQLASEITNHKETLRNALRLWRSINQRKKYLTEQKAMTERKQQLSDELRILQQKVQQALSAQKELLVHKEALHTYAQQRQKELLEKVSINQRLMEQNILEHKRIEEKVDELEQKKVTTDQEIKKNEQELSIVNELLVQSAADQALLVQEQASFERRKSYYHTFSAEGASTKKEFDALKHKIDLVNNEHAPACPLCEQNLSASRKRFLKSKFSINEATLTQKLKRLYHVTGNLKQILIAQHEQIQRIEKSAQTNAVMTNKQTELIAKQKKQEQEKVIFQTQLNLLTEQKNEYQKKNDTLATALKNAQHEFATLAHQSTYQDLQTSVEKAEKQIHQNSYVPQDITAREQELQIIDQYMAQHTNLHHEVTQQEERKKHIHLLCATIKKLVHERTMHEEHLIAESVLNEEEKILNNQIKTIQEKKEHLLSARQTLMHTQGSTENKIELLQKQTHAFAEREKKIKATMELIDNLQVIAAALGKDGLQAILIEQAIPEIEQEANAILSKLSDNQAHIIIESLRDLKRGGTRETLDIKISDALGVRPYELFSGGEAFRIDFAIRVSISRLLARRAGTSLQTLIIDEGFGSQDEEGLGRIMDAIYKVQDDFSKIIIVSHLPSMKDQFPVHFVITKNADGSMVDVLEQG